MRTTRLPPTLPGHLDASTRRRARTGRASDVLVCALLLAGALAAGIGSRAHAAAVLWVTPTAQGAATLQGDGEVRLYAADGAVTVVGRSVRGDSLQWCGGRILGVDGDGRLRAFGAAPPDVGPAVSPHSRPACLSGGRVVALSSDARTVLLLSHDLKTIASHTLDALPDGDPIPLGNGVAVLSHPTQRYRHGVLGDEIEAAAVTLLRQDDLSPIATLTLAAPAVIEQRRVQPFAAAGAYGMLITRSTPDEGAGVEAIALQGDALVPVASAPPIGAGDRWLNLFAATGDHAYAVRTPHLGGPLERLRKAGTHLLASRFALDVTNHTLGSRNLDLGLLLPPPAGATVDVLALPTLDLRSVRLVACDGAGCTPVAVLELDAPLSSNLAARWRGKKLALYAGEGNGELQTFLLDASPWQAPQAP